VRRSDKQRGRKARAGKATGRQWSDAAGAPNLRGWLEAALTHHRAGRWVEAERLYRCALDVDGDHPEALHLLGLLSHQRGQSETAEGLVRRAIDVAPQAAVYHDTLGTILMSQGHAEAAVAAHHEAVARTPDHPAAMFNLGNALDAVGRSLEAVQRYRRVLEQRPDHVKARFNLANTLSRLGHVEEAERQYRTVLAQSPEMAGAATNLAGLLQDQGRGDEAVAFYRTVVQQKPDDPIAHFNLGRALQGLGRPEEAELWYRAALKHAPHFVEALDNLGTVLLKLKAQPQAVACHRLALRHAPISAQARIRHNLGNALKAIQDFQSAEETFAAALDLEPDLADAAFNLGLLQLSRGDLVAGWSNYDRRFASGNAVPNRRFTVPRWQSPAESSGPVLIWREQGVGDEIMFASCFTDAIAGATFLRLECDPRLVEIIRRSFPTFPAEAVQAETRDVEAGTVSVARESPAGSLPRLFRPRLSAFPRRTGFLLSDPSVLTVWRDRLASLGDDLKVGICWRSGLIDEERAGNYTDLSDWAPVFAVPGITFVNLQYDASPDDFAQAEDGHSVGLAHWPDVDLKQDIDTFLALVANLDLVVTAPTAVGEIAAAAGTPTWRFSARHDWSWLGTGVRPWYPAMRVFQPNPGEPLATVLRRIAQALRQRVARTIRRPEGKPDMARSDGDDRTAVEALLDQAMVLHRDGRWEAAETRYRDLLQQVPDHADGLNLLGILLYQRGRAADAVPLLQAAVRAAPSFAGAHHHLGLALQDQGETAAAIACLERALALKPDFPEALTHLGRLRQGEDHLDEAEALHRRALALNPDLPDAHTNLGFLYEDQARFAQAEACYRRVVALRPNLAEAHNNLGMVLQCRQRPALAHFQKALALDPEHALAHWNRGLVLLAKGDLTTGWADYGWRFQARQLQKGRTLPLPVWRGEPLGQARLLVWGEQGLGDEILFASCYRDLTARGVPGTLEASPRLVPLYRRSFPALEACDEAVDARRRELRTTPDADRQIAAGSLPRK